MWVFVRLLSLSLSVSFFVQPSMGQKSLALTFDDSPRFATGYFDGPTRAKKLIKTLKEHQSGPVVFFSNSERLDQEGLKRMKAYTKAGHLIANHTHSHPDINKLGINDYINDFKKADRKLAKLKNFKKYFRFPYLREGNTKIKRDKMRKALKQMGYQNAYVSLDNSDYYMEVLFQEAYKKNSNLNLSVIKNFYLENMLDSIEFYDKMASQYLKRSPKHILLLHEMDITALFVGDLIDKLRQRGWKIISLKEALADPIANYKTSKIFKYNPGRIGEIASDKGLSKKQLWPQSADESFLRKDLNKRLRL